jgi:YfiR/HmsC-like
VQNLRTDLRGFLRRLGAALGLLLVAGVALAQAPSPNLESQVKVAFLYNFVKFVEWPGGTSDKGSFVICVLSDAPFSTTLEQAVKDKTVNGRALEVRRLKGLEEAIACRMVYLDSQASSRIASVPAAMQSAAVLTVGDGRGFLRQGGIIGFILQDNKVRFQINPDAAERAGLKISSKLLQLATIVRRTAQAEDR